MTFNTSVLVNNLLALKAFRTFLNNYKQHEMPRGLRKNVIVRWLERKLISFLGSCLRKVSRQRFLIEISKNVIENHAAQIMAELLRDDDAKKAFMSLKDAPVGMFAVLYIIQNPHLMGNGKTGKEIFNLISETELTVALLKNPREEQSYK